MLNVVDLYTPAAPGSLTRSRSLHAIGLFRLARRSAELYSVQIISAGAWARIKVRDGTGRELFHQPSSFTGSFWLGGGAEDGIVVEVHARDSGPNLTINWREPDRERV